MFRARSQQGMAMRHPLLRLRVLSLGAGVQSATLAILAAHGIVGAQPDCAIFADTGWEPASVYALCAG